MNVTSNRLLALRDKRARVGCSVSRAHAVKALSPGCLPWILPRRETSALAAHVERNAARSASGMVTTNLRLSSCNSAVGGVFVGSDIAVCVRARSSSIPGTSLSIELLVSEERPLLPARMIFSSGCLKLCVVYVPLKQLGCFQLLLLLSCSKSLASWFIRLALPSSIQCCYIVPGSISYLEEILHSLYLPEKPDLTRFLRSFALSEKPCSICYYTNFTRDGGVAVVQLKKIVMLFYLDQSYIHLQFVLSITNRIGTLNTIFSVVS